MRKLTLLVSVLYGAMCSVQAGALTPIHLKDAVAKAQTVSPQAEISDLQVDFASARSRQARAKTGFQVGIEGELGASYVDFTSNDASLTPNQIGIGAQKVLYSSGQLEAGIKRSDLEIEAAKFGSEQTRNSLAMQTSLAYGNLWFAEQAVGIRQKKVETLNLHLRQADARFAQGENTKTDISLAKARLAEAEAELAGAKAALAAASATLSRLSGVEDPRTTIRDLETAIHIPVTGDVALNKVLGQYPGLQAAKASARAAGEGVREAKGGFGPKLSLDVSAGTAQDSFFFFTDRINDTKALLKFSVPLYTSGMKKASVDAARVQKAIAEARIRDTALKLREQYTSLQGRLAARRAALAAAKRGVEAATNRTSGARKEYEAGLRTFVNLMDAEDERRIAEIRKAAAERDLFATKIRLLELMGALNSQLN
ncbi:MAG TPA: TolC family protein [Hellea balneolensis]|uniref:TolC family protein n=1 Tax=Hellea balneolensis TaxID=287478 RepID=A0A7C5QQN9_9PROT|nr:TolC family protein [Hellea balneolensis]